MFIWKFMVACHIVFTGCQGALTCPEIAEESTRVTLTCQNNLPQFVWRAPSRVGATRNVSDCFGQCTDLVPGYEGSFLNLSTQPPLYESSLTIEAIIRNESKFWCNKDFCTVKVYVKPMQSNCASYSLGHYGSPHRSFLEIKVEVAESYPEAKCFMKTNPASRMNDIALPQITNTKLSNGNFNTTCQYGVSLNGTLPNSYQLTVSVYPNVNSNDTRISMEAVCGLLNIRAPTATLGPDCPVSTIRGTSTVNCSCMITEPGYPEGWVTWYTLSNQETGRRLNDNLTILTVSYDTKDLQSKFYCSAESALGRFDPKVFSPVFAGQQTTNEDMKSSSDQTAIVAGCVSAAVIVAAVATAIGIVLAVKYLKRNADPYITVRSPNLSAIYSYPNENNCSGMTDVTPVTRARVTQVNPRLERNIPSQRGSVVTSTAVTVSDDYSFSEYDFEDSNATDSSSQTYAIPITSREV